MPSPRKDSVQHDGACQLEGGDHDERGQHVGQDVAQDDAHRRAAERADRLDELARAKHQHLGAEDARVADPAREPDDDDQRREARAQDGDDADREQDEGKCQLRVRHRHDDGIHGAAAVPRREAQRRADEPAHEHGREADHERHPRAVDHAGEDVATEVVHAEEMRAAVGALQRRRLQAGAQRLALGVLHHPRRHDRQQRQERHEAKPQPHEPGHAPAAGARLLHRRQGELSRRGRGDRGRHRGGRRRS